MKHFTKLILVMVMTVFCLTACSKGGKDITVDVNALAEKLQSETITSGEITNLASEMLFSTYYIESDQMENGAAYLSSTGEIACEVVVVECKEASQTGDVEELFKNRVDSRTIAFSDYRPNEVPKLDSAIITSAGKYVVLCVCDDTAKAEEILKEYGF